MKEVKYVPGDLVRIEDSVNWFTKDGEIMRVTESDDNRFVKVTNNNFATGDHLVMVKNIIPIPLTHAILEVNGWKKEPSENVTWYKYRTDKSNLYICKDSFNNKDWLVCVCLDKHYIANINYVHQLQHLLFGLRLNSELKV